LRRLSSKIDLSAVFNTSSEVAPTEVVSENLENRTLVEDEEKVNPITPS
jgi:hypothetical protein